MKKTRWVICISLFIMSNVYAVKVSSLYQGEVPASSQSAEVRQQGIVQAIEQVLIKVSGDEKIMQNPSIKSFLPSARRLVEEYGYSVPQKSIAKKQPYLLQVRFDEKGINQWLRKANAPVWGANRPLILALIEIEIPNQPAHLLSSEEESIATIIKTYASKRGLPFILPLMDTMDINQVNTTEITTLPAANLANIARRYHSKAILIGKITQHPGECFSNWRLILGNEHWEWQTPGTTMTTIFANAINYTAETLRQQYAIKTTTTIQKTLGLKVVGVLRASDFNQLLRYLAHLTPIADLSVAQISADEILLDVSIRSSDEAFAHALAAGQKLTPVALNETDRVYQWNP